MVKAETSNRELAGIFKQMADVMVILDISGFKVNAFNRAARAIGDLTYDLSSVGPDVVELGKIEGVGKGSAQRIAEYLETGVIADHGELLGQIPAGLLDLLGIQGLGPKTIAMFWREAGVEGLEQLKAKLVDDQLTALPGMGAKKLDKLRKSIEFAQQASGRVRIGMARPLAIWLIEQLGRLEEVKQITYAGSLRRGRDTIGDIDLLVGIDEDNEGAAGRVSDAFVNLDPVREVLVKGNTKTSVRVDAPGQPMQVDLRVVPMESFGAALMYFTGSQAHNVAMRERAIKQGMTLNEYGLANGNSDDPGEVVAAGTEHGVFEAMGLQWIAPALREDRGEVTLAESGKLPKLVEVKDIKAELHAHTDASDGKWSIREYALACAERGFHTVAVTDHSKSQPIANGLSDKRLEKHIKDVRKVAEELKGTIAVLTGSEVDILADGSLDYPDSLLSELDVVVASPHVALGQEPGVATDRLLKAIENPHVTILGHPTGRLIGRRPGLSPDMSRIIEAAGERGVALEINANSYRLDLRDVHAKAAIEAGVKLAINTDAHGEGDLDELVYGVLTAQRAGVGKKDVVNCMSQGKLLKWLKGRR